VKAPRFFVSTPLAHVARGGEVALPGAVGHHAARVLRLSAGSRIVLFDGRGGEYVATLTRLDKRGAFASLDAHVAVERESPVAVTLAQGVLAADAMDYAVRKAVELGAAAIVPILGERSQRGASDRNERRRAHWQAIAIAACEQCGRNRVPPVASPVGLATFVEHALAGGIVAIADPEATRSLASLAASTPPAAVAIGPEGGFTQAELHDAKQRGASVVHLGPRVLRAETAAVAALAMLSAVAGDAR
jgi:16S rRNA (uracil1498-N3)-methyltransferase